MNPGRGPAVESQHFSNSLSVSQKHKRKDDSISSSASASIGTTRNNIVMLGSSIETVDPVAIQEEHTSSEEDEDDNIDRESLLNSRMKVPLDQL